MQELHGTLIFTQEDVAYLWRGGTLAIKIDAPDLKVSLDVRYSQAPNDGRRQSLRIKRVAATRESSQ